MHFSQILGVVMEKPFWVEHQSLQREERHGEQDEGARTVTRTETRRQGEAGDGQVRSDSTGDMEMKRTGHQNREDGSPAMNGMTGGHGMNDERHQQAQGKEDQQNPGAAPVRPDQQWNKGECHPCDSWKGQRLTGGVHVKPEERNDENERPQKEPRGNGWASRWGAGGECAEHALSLSFEEEAGNSMR